LRFHRTEQNSRDGKSFANQYQIGRIVYQGGIAIIRAGFSRFAPVLMPSFNNFSDFLRLVFFPKVEFRHCFMNATRALLQVGFQEVARKGFMVFVLTSQFFNWENMKKKLIRCFSIRKFPFGVFAIRKNNSKI